MPDILVSERALRRRKLLFQAGIGGVSVAVFLAIVIALLPVLATWQARTRLEAHGARLVAVEGLIINPANGEISVEKFRSVGPDGEDIVIGAARLRISLSALASRRITIRTLSIADADIDLRLDDKGRWSVGGFPMSFARDGAKPEPESAWQLKANNISIDNSRITLAIGPTIHSAMIDRLRLDTVSTLRPNEPTTMELSAQAAGGTLKFTGKAYPFARLPRTAFAVILENIDLSTLEPLISTGRIKTVRGTAALDGRVEMGMTKFGTTISYAGIASLSDTGTDTTLFSGRAKKLLWEGSARATYGIPDDHPGLQPDIHLRGVASASAFTFVNRITGTALEARTARFDLSKTGANMHVDRSGTEETNINGQLSATLGGVRLEQPDSGIRIAPEHLDVNSRFELVLPPRTAAFSAQLSGEVDSRKIVGSLRSAGVDKISAAALRLNVDTATMKFDAEGGISAEIGAKLNISSLILDAPEIGTNATAGRIDSPGQNISFVRKKDGAVSLILAGRIEAEHLRSRSADNSWSIRQEGLSWQGSISVEGPGGNSQKTSRLQASGDAALRDVTADLVGAPYTVKLGSAAISGIVVDGGNARLTTASFRRVSGAGKHKDSPLPALLARDIFVSGVTVTDAGHVSVGSMRASGLSGRITRLASGKISLPESKPGPEYQSQAPSQKSKYSDKIARQTYRIGKAIVTDSRIELIDLNVRPPFSIAADPFQVTLEGLDTSIPDNKASIDILAGLEKYGRVQVRGKFTPEYDPITADLNIGFTNLELIKFNPYIAPAIAHTVRQGRADGEIDVQLRAGRLKAETSLTLSRLKVRPVPVKPGNTKRKNAASGGPPLETAIGLLQNDRGIMKLSIPVSGSLDDPKFDLSDAIGQAITGAMKETILTAVRIAFPLGTIVAIVNAVGDPEIKVKPLNFTPGSSSLSPGLKEKIAEIGAYLKKRPDEAPSICAPATVVDLQALKKPNSAVNRQTALDVAAARINAVKTELVTTHAIFAGRLFVCLPEFSTDDGQTPYVEITLKR